MNILAIDTATEACSVALLQGSYSNEDIKGSDAFVLDGTLDGIFEVCPQQHSQLILSMIDTVLNRNSLSINQIDAIAYGRGPGSFTGVRIAASTAQGLSLGANLPVLEVSNLAAMAQETYEKTGAKEVFVLIDARMQEVYCGHFKIDKGVACLQGEESVISPEIALAKLNELDARTALAGTGFTAYETLFQSQVQKKSVALELPNAKFMLALAYKAFINNNMVASDQIAPVYVRDKVTWKKLPGRE